MMPPCRKNGKDCPLRRAGCQARCDAYKEYRAEREAQYKRNVDSVKIGDVLKGHRRRR